MTLLELQKALREGKAVTNDGGKTFITIENGAFALWDGETTQLLSASPYIKFRPDGFLNDDTGYKLFSTFVRFDYPAIILTLHPDHTFDYFSLELRYSDYDKYITPLIIDEGKEGLINDRNIA